MDLICQVRWQCVAIYKGLGGYKQELRTNKERNAYSPCISQLSSGLCRSMKESKSVKKQDSKKVKVWFFQRKCQEDASPPCSSQPSAGLYWTSPSLPKRSRSAKAWYSWPWLPGTDSRGAGELLLQNFTLKTFLIIFYFYLFMLQHNCMMLMLMQQHM